MLPCCIARCRVRARSGAPLVVCAVATGYQLWTWPPLGTGAAISCPVVPGVWVIWGSWWHEKHRIDASPARAALIRSMPPKVQTTSPKNGKNGLFWVRWSAIWANPGTRQTRPPTTATFPRNTADKSPPQQHDLSILRLIGHVVLLGSYLARLGMPFSSARGPTIPSLGCLILTWTRYSESGQPRPRTEQRVNVRNRRPTCETAGSHAGRVGTQVAVAHGQSMTDHGAPTHRPAMQHSQELGKHDHLQKRLSRATKPKSHPASNTICPSS